jgi:hypothetical protein
MFPLLVGAVRKGKRFFLERGRIMAKGKKREVLVVGSKVKGYVRSKKMLCSSELIEAASCAVAKLLDAAANRAKENGRSTVRARDL